MTPLLEIEFEFDNRQETNTRAEETKEYDDWRKSMRLVVSQTMGVKITKGWDSEHLGMVFEVQIRRSTIWSEVYRSPWHSQAENPKQATCLAVTRILGIVNGTCRYKPAPVVRVGKMLGGLLGEDIIRGNHVVKFSTHHHERMINEGWNFCRWHMSWYEAW